MTKLIPVVVSLTEEEIDRIKGVFASPDEALHKSTHHSMITTKMTAKIYLGLQEDA